MFSEISRVLRPNGRVLAGRGTFHGDVRNIFPGPALITGKGAQLPEENTSFLGLVIGQTDPRHHPWSSIL